MARAKASRWFATLTGPEAVSYTHLDVYKRQGLSVMRQTLEDVYLRLTHEALTSSDEVRS